MLLIPTILLGLVLIVAYSCSKEDLNPAVTCIDTANPCNAGETFKTCAYEGSTGTGYYEYNGKKYNWTSANLNDVATQLANDMCDKKSGDINTRYFIEDRAYEVLDHK